MSHTMNPTSSTQKSLSVVLDEIEQRAEAATPGPWALNPTGDVGAWLIGTAEHYVADCDTGEEKFMLDNAAFIAAARTDVPALVKALRRAIDEIHQDNLLAWSEGGDSDFMKLRAIARATDKVPDEIAAILTKGEQP